MDQYFLKLRGKRTLIQSNLIVSAAAPDSTFTGLQESFRTQLLLLKSGAPIATVSTRFVPGFLDTGRCSVLFFRKRVPTAGSAFLDTTCLFLLLLICSGIPANKVLFDFLHCLVGQGSLYTGLDCLVCLMDLWITEMERVLSGFSLPSPHLVCKIPLDDILLNRRN